MPSFKANLTSFSIKPTIRLCVENGLTPSDIKRGIKKETSQNHKAPKQTLRDQLKQILDVILSKSKTIEEFKMNLTEQKIEFAKRFMRGDTLGENYTTKRLIERLGEPLNNPKVQKEQKIIIHDTPKLLNILTRQNNYGMYTKSNISINFEKRLYYQARNQKIQDVKSLANQLLFIRKEEIKSMSDFDQKIKEIRKTGNEVKDNIKQLETKYKKLSTIYKELVTYQENREVYEKYQKIKFRFNKERYYDKNIGAINLAEGSLNILRKANIAPTTNIEEISSYLKEINHKLKPLKNEYRTINEKLNRIKEVKEYTQEINNRNKKEDRKIKRNIDLER